MNEAAATPAKRKTTRKPKAEPAALADAAAVGTAGQRGGARTGSGRKSAALEAATADAHIMKAKAQAKKEVFLAQMAELDFRKASGELVPRAEVRQASATAFATIAQSLRSIQDNLERRLGIAPEIAEEVGLLIDESLNTLADELEKMAAE